MSDPRPARDLGPARDAPPGLPLVEELTPAPDPEEAFVRWSAWPRCVFFDSALHDPRLGRYSFLAADPFAWRSGRAEEADWLARLDGEHRNWTAPLLPDLPPFQGGLAGLFGYELGGQLERVPAPRWDEFQFPWLAAGWYDAVLAFDHQRGRAWLVSHGFPERDPKRRHARAARRLRLFRDATRGIGLPEPRAASSATRVSAPEALAPQFPVAGFAGLSSNFARDGYLSAVDRAIEYIRAGDIFQVNLAQRLLHPAESDSLSLYLRLRKRNAATFAAYFDLGEFQVLSASPERFLEVRDGRVETRPIKGTRSRAGFPEADLLQGDELRQSRKDRAENVMIVDLLRNDLSKVCEADGVEVTQLCELETYAFVQHLVSCVRGRLRPGQGPLDLLRAAFPGGSITGAPKPRAMEIVAELEPTARGPYCGSLAYLGFDGTFDSNILIRTIAAGRGWWQMPVGGGIVADSDPLREYQETWHKAEGLLRDLKP